MSVSPIYCDTVDMLTHSLNLYVPGRAASRVRIVVVAAVMVLTFRRNSMFVMKLIIINWLGQSLNLKIRHILSILKNIVSNVYTKFDDDRQWNEKALVLTTRTTRWAGQSPTWGRPAPQVRVESQFKYSKFLSQQRQLVNDSEKNHLAYGLASAYSIRAFRVDQYARCNFFDCGPKFITCPENVSWEYSHYPRSYKGAHAKF